MKRLFTLALTILFIGSVCAQSLSPKAQAQREQWSKNKYSMFIHFGIYSELGGVWKGKNISYGYSEQIQAHAGIYSDTYANVASRFNPTLFCADSIVALAKEAGMRSIVITSKHHDGFCLWNTATTDFNATDATPGKRDFIKELSDACHKENMGFGLYFSIIDWHYPQAYPISSHNCDYITPEHHNLNKQQVTELTTKYGDISELWFDMGSNTPQQSKDLYDIVRQNQPGCMVSGRLGHGFYDFAVMGDNYYPEATLQTSWQSCASMFDETWGYRSWQERCEPHEKAMEKLRSLIQVVSYGGNFLLNIGPKGDGSVVTFEKEVLREMGEWLQQHGNAIYDTEACPFREKFDWGHITRKGNQLFLLLSGKKPADNTIRFTMNGYEITNTRGPLEEASTDKGTVTVNLSAGAYNSRTIGVVELTFDKEIDAHANPTEGKTPNYSYFCFDYNTNHRSITSYQWDIKKPNAKAIEFTYTPEEAGTTLDVEIDGESYQVVLNEGTAQPLKTDKKTVWGQVFIGNVNESWFEGPVRLKADLDNPVDKNNPWIPAESEQGILASKPMSTNYIIRNVYSPKAQQVLVNVGSTTGVQVYLNGETIAKHLNPYHSTFRQEKVLLNLKQGNNLVAIRSYNRFFKKNQYMLMPSTEQVIYKQTFTLPTATTNATHHIVVKRAGLASQHADTELHNLQLILK